jgi:hypothetical protein
VRELPSLSNTRVRGAPGPGVKFSVRLIGASRMWSAEMASPLAAAAAKALMMALWCLSPSAPPPGQHVDRILETAAGILQRVTPGSAQDPPDVDLLLARSVTRTAMHRAAPPQPAEPAHHRATPRASQQPRQEAERGLWIR